MRRSNTTFKTSSIVAPGLASALVVVAVFLATLGPVPTAAATGRDYNEGGVDATTSGGLVYIPSPSHVRPRSTVGKGNEPPRTWVNLYKPLPKGQLANFMCYVDTTGDIEIRFQLWRSESFTSPRRLKLVFEQEEQVPTGVKGVLAVRFPLSPLFLTFICIPMTFLV